MVYSCQRSGYFRSNESKGIRIIAIENQKEGESKPTCPKGVFTKEEFLEMVKGVNHEREKKEEKNCLKERSGMAFQFSRQRRQYGYNYSGSINRISWICLWPR